MCRRIAYTYVIKREGRDLCQSGGDSDWLIRISLPSLTHTQWPPVFNLCMQLTTVSAPCCLNKVGSIIHCVVILARATNAEEERRECEQRRQFSLSRFFDDDDDDDDDNLDVCIYLFYLFALSSDS